jgi:DNA-binding GntR family transcriptional regulator
VITLKLANDDDLVQSFVSVLVVRQDSPAMNRPAALNLVEPLDRQTLGERAYTQLSELLFSGRMAPGDKLSLRQAADVLGVSIMPVREAVSRLVADKALEVTPNRAIRVPLMTAAQFRDLTQARVAIEGHVAAIAARTRNDTDLQLIAQAEAAMRAESLATAPDLPRAVELNKTFHFAVYEAAHSPTLVEIIRALWLKVGPVINLDLRANPERLAKGDAIRFHAEVLAAIKAGDEAGARAGISADISSAADVILSRGGLMS